MNKVEANRHSYAGNRSGKEERIQVTHGCRCPHCCQTLLLDAKITIKLPKIWRELIEELAKERNESVSELIRAGIGKLLAEADKLPVVYLNE